MSIEEKVFSGGNLYTRDGVYSLHFTHLLTAKEAQKFNSGISVHCLLNIILINATWYTSSGQSTRNITAGPACLTMNLRPVTPV